MKITVDNTGLFGKPCFLPQTSVTGGFEGVMRETRFQSKKMRRSVSQALNLVFMGKILYFAFPTGSGVGMWLPARR